MHLKVAGKEGGIVPSYRRKYRIKNEIDPKLVFKEGAAGADPSVIS